MNERGKNEDFVQEQTKIFTIFQNRDEGLQKQKTRKVVQDSFLKSCFCQTPPLKIAHPLLWIFIGILSWGAAWGMLKESALPKGHIFSLVILIVASTLGGKLVQKCFLPSYLGMLFIGFAFKNISSVNSIITEHLKEEWSFHLRNLLLTLFILRCIVQLDLKAALNFHIWKKILQMAFLPCLFELLIVVCLNFWILNLKGIYAFLLGCLISCSACYEGIPRKSFATERQNLMSTIFKCIQALDNIIIMILVAIFTTALLQTSLTSEITTIMKLKTALCLIVNILYGVITGMLSGIFPESTKKNILSMRCLFCFLGGLFPIVLCARLNYPGFGMLGSIIFFTTSIQAWRYQNWEEMPDFINLLESVWMTCQPILFGLIGSSLKIEMLDYKVIAWSVLIIAIGLLFRSLVVYFTCPSNENETSKLKICLISLSKVSGQAVLGGFIMDSMRNQTIDNKQIYLIHQTLYISILAVIITSPFFSATGRLLYPVLVRPIHPKRSIDKIMENYSYANPLPIIEEETHL